jgi:hypothetical protein
MAAVEVVRSRYVLEKFFVLFVFLSLFPFFARKVRVIFEVRKLWVDPVWEEILKFSLGHLSLPPKGRHWETLALRVCC